MERAEIKHNISRIGFIYLLVLILSEISCVGVQYLALNTGLLPESTDDAYANILIFLGTVPMYIVSFPLLILLMRSTPKQSPARRHISPLWAISLIFISFSFMYAGAFIGNRAAAFVSSISGLEITNDTSDLIERVSIPLIILMVCIIGPVCEELMYRKLLMDHVLPYSKHAAVLLSAVMFGLFHMNIFQIFYAAMLGFVLAIIYLNTGNIRYTIALHMIINFFGSVVSLILERYATNEILLLYGFLLIVVIIVGLVLFFTHVNGFRISISEDEPSPREARRLALSAPGVITFAIFTVGFMVADWFL